MKLIPFIADLTALVAVWRMVGSVIFRAPHIDFPFPEAHAFETHRVTLPGSILGDWAGYRVYQRVSGDNPGRNLR